MLFSSFNNSASAFAISNSFVVSSRVIFSCKSLFSKYAYFENKLLQEKITLEETTKELEIAKAEAELLKEEKSKPKKTCGCC